LSCDETAPALRVSKRFSVNSSHHLLWSKTLVGERHSPIVEEDEDPGEQTQAQGTSNTHQDDGQTLNLGRFFVSLQIRTQRTTTPFHPTAGFMSMVGQDHTFANEDLEQPTANLLELDLALSVPTRRT
ncbi:unnamed protein product, partial [Fusarium graminearum]